MNTRLQVEHPVTELVTGLDLVELMIRVAAGEALPLIQSDVQLNGWAVESRIYAEDPTRNFLPSIGRLTTYRPPEEGTDGTITVRNDTGVEEGGEIAIHYDPMIAKLVTHAPTRAEAIRAQGEALDAFAIEGIRHNIPFLAALMAHPRWQEGRLSTGFIAEEFAGGFSAPAPEAETARRMAAAAAAIDHQANERKRTISGQMRDPRSLRFERERVVLLGTERFPVSVDTAAEGIAVAFADGPTWTVASDWRPGEPVWRGTIDGASVALQVRGVLNGVALSLAGTAATARVYTRREAELAALMPEKTAGGSGKQVLCPMPGLVKAILVKTGQEVKVGEPLAIVEAMKMENVLRAERDAAIGAIQAKEGDSLAVDAVIMEFA
jgi:propionyl-CoA carboxylase alpha chain